jgi:hypothetical protein
MSTRMTETSNPDHPAAIEVELRGPLRARPRDPADKRSQVLAYFIEGDVQGVEETAQEWLDRIAAVERGAVAEDDGTGNAYTLTLRPDGATLEHATFTDWPAEHYTLAEIRTALEQVLAVLAARSSGG